MAFTRRAFLASGGATAAVAAAAGVGYAAGQTGDDDGSGTPGGGSHVVPFHGAHQAGIATPAQDRLHFAAFDVVPGVKRAELQQLLKDWTLAAATMSTGQPVGGGAAGAQLAPPDDTGEAQDLTPANLTVTFGFGPSLFDDRFGLAQHKPKKLSALPDLPGDALDRDRSDGDLCVQACANDPQVAFHAIRNLARIGRGLVTVRWSQLGFGRTSTTSRAQATPRNLMGFKDGTANIKLEDQAELSRFVWVGGDAADEPAWLAGGSYLVARRIRMLIEVWDRAPLRTQEETIGRTKTIGAPLGGTDEFETLKPKALPADSHVRLAHPDTNDGVKILRRGYSFTDGLESLGQLDAGLFFLAYLRDPAAFVTLQNRLGANDSLNEYIKHVGSGLWAIPPGVTPGGYVGQALFSA